MKFVIPARGYRGTQLEPSWLEFEPGKDLCVLDYLCGDRYSSPRIGNPLALEVKKCSRGGRRGLLVVDNVCSIVKSVDLPGLGMKTTLSPLPEIKGHEENPYKRKYYFNMIGKVFVGDMCKIQEALKEHWPDYSIS